MGITTLPIINEVGPLLHSINFPNYPYVIRGPEANTACCLKSDVSLEWNLGNVDKEFLSIQDGTLNVLTANGDFNLSEQLLLHYQKPKPKMHYLLPSHLEVLIWLQQMPAGLQMAI